MPVGDKTVADLIAERSYGEDVEADLRDAADRFFRSSSAFCSRLDIDGYIMKESTKCTGNIAASADAAFAEIIVPTVDNNVILVQLIQLPG